MKNNGINISEWVASLSNRKPFYLAIVNKEGLLTFTNSRFYTHFVSRESVTKDNLFDLVHQGDQLQLRNTLIACSSQETPVTTEIRIVNGHSHWIKWEISCVKRPEHDEKFLFLGYDIAGEEQLIKVRQEEKKVSERLLYISKATSEAIWDWNIQSGQLYFNQALHDLVGTDPGQVFDLDWCYQCVHAEDKEMLQRTIRSALDRKEQSWDAEYRFLCPDGQYKMMHNRGFIIYEAGEPIRMVGSLQDVSEIRKLETQLVKQKLKQQKGVAEAIIKAQEDERTRIGHELHDNINQILASGQLYLDLLNIDTENFTEIKDKTMEILQLAIEEIRMLSWAMVVPDLKDGSLIANINDLVTDLRYVNIFEINFSHSKSCELELMSQSTKITIFRIVQEQTKNIVKYSKASHVDITLHIHDDRIRLEIKDDGQGFDPKTTRRGLGLSNIYERTKLYNGMVILNTAPGKGCSIIVNIPFGPQVSLT